MSIDLDPVEDMFADEAARTVGKFQPKYKARPPIVEASTSVSSIVAAQTSDSSKLVRSVEPSENQSTASPSEEEVSYTLNPVNAEEQLAIPVFSTVTDSTHTHNVAAVPTCFEPSAETDALTLKKTMISRSDGGVRMDTRGLEGEEMHAMDSVNMSELAIKSDQRTGKFQPKPRVPIQKKICATENDSVSGRPGSPPIPAEIGYAENFPPFEHDDVLDLSSTRVTHNIPIETTYELPLNDENLININQLEGVPGLPAKLSSRHAKTERKKSPMASDPSLQQQKACTSSQENETGRSLRSRKSKTSFHKQGDDPEDEAPDSREFSDEFISGSPTEEEYIDNEQFHVESEYKMKKVRLKSKRPHGGKEKPDKKRTKAKEASAQGEDAKPKRFSRSTRRRRVDKILLATPEDEIDFQKVPLRDLILLAEHKERQIKKEEAAAGNPSTKQSNGNSSACRDEDETFNSRRGGEYDDGQASPVAEESNMYFNYQTYMDRTPSTRWSKQDTELFYEGVRQFGTDLSMIQHLFPGRTRRQVKLKYKKEERQHPLMLHDALINRAKEHFHFNMVIERLKQIAAEENQDTDKDESIDLTGGVVEEEHLNGDDEEARTEHFEDTTNDDVVEAAQRPVKLLHDSEEDDFFVWSEYKSDL